MSEKSRKVSIAVLAVTVFICILWIIYALTSFIIDINEYDETVSVLYPIKKQTVTRRPTILAFGNPFLEMTITVNESDYSKCQDVVMSANCVQKLITNHELLPFRTMHAGGSVQNMMTIMQSLYSCSGIEHTIGVFHGSIGNDTNGKLMTEMIYDAGIEARYAVYPSFPTGFSVSLVNGKKQRSVSFVGSASFYSINDLENSNIAMDSSKIVYVDGFFLTHSPLVARQAINNACKNNASIVFNLNNAFIMKSHLPLLQEVILKSNIVIGTKKEFADLATLLNTTYDSYEELPSALNRWKNTICNYSTHESEEWLFNKNIFVMSEGYSESSVIAWGKNESIQIPPTSPESPIVDVTDARDSFTSGFLAGIVENHDPKTCLAWGSALSSVIVTKVGVFLPTDEICLKFSSPGVR